MAFGFTWTAKCSDRDQWKCIQDRFRGGYLLLPLIGPCVVSRCCWWSVTEMRDEVSQTGSEACGSDPDECVSVIDVEWSRHEEFL